MIEIIVVLVIIVVLIAIAFPVLSATFRKAKNTRAAADIAAIGTGLEAYKADFGDFPRASGNTGFAVLGKALIAPGPSGGFQPVGLTMPVPAGTVQSQGTPGTPGYSEHVAFGGPNGSGGFGTSAAPSDNTQWAQFPVSDGIDGPGFRARPGGKKYNPYLPAEKFRLSGLAILDANNNPILYFPARPQKPAQTPPWALVNQSDAALYNANHNLSFFLRPGETIGGNAPSALKRMEAVLVLDNADFDNVMDAGEKPATTREYLLWSAGPDGSFGVTFAGTNPTKDDIRKCDDITNFTGQSN